MARSDLIWSGDVGFHPDLKQILYPIDSVSPHPENYNCGDLDAIDDSITENGMVAPVVAQKSTGWILGGNHTWMTCKERDAEVIPVIWLDVDDTAARKIMIGLNRTASLAKPDKGLLLAMIAKIQADAGDVRGTAYTAADVKAIQTIAAMEPAYERDSWPTLTFTLHPRLVKAYRDLTREADTAADAFELLLRLSGWDGK